MILRALRWLLTRQHTDPPACESIDWAAIDARLDELDFEDWEAEMSRRDAS